MLIVFVVVLAAAFTVPAVLAKQKSGGSKGTQKRKYSRYFFRQMARGMGLDKHHVQSLEALIKAQKVRQPLAIFTHSNLLDDLLQQALMSLENDEQLTDEQRQERTLEYYQIKQLIEKNSKSRIGINSTHFLEPGQILNLITADKKKSASKVVANLSNAVACAVPVQQDAEVRLASDTRLKVSFWRESDAGYSFLTTVIDYEAIKGTECLLIQHAKSLHRDQQRSSRRRATEQPCYYHAIQIEEAGKGRKKRKKAVLDQERLSGTITNISAGGCSIGTRTPVNSGQLLKLEFDIEEQGTIALYGKAKRIQQEGARTYLMHVMFTKVSANSLNQIYSYVYNYSPG